MKRLLVLTPFILGSCASASEPQFNARAASKLPITSIVMEQFTCFWGTCPHYVVSINSDGSGTYVGLEVAKKRGSVDLKLSPTAFEEIEAEIRRIKLVRMKPQYYSEEHGCKEVWSDQSSLTFYVTFGDSQTKVVSLYYGCTLPGVSDKLSNLASLVDRVTEVEPLLGRSR
ncbi:DUF6438 domain-containing protein [Pseudomarimonas salicorniae]|uniref:DUF6438 domain-containing protein n=1 Tax=Pseudomarimonas salicorniae TaxID=2933270 RepID=UPI0020029D58|nr:DUF6438 domain-containing protein [Lysobacter sp. CAU 1642]